MKENIEDISRRKYRYMSREKIQYVCDSCNKEFTTKFNLNYHLNHTTACAEKRGDITDIHECMGCRKILSERALIRHSKICPCILNKHITEETHNTEIQKLKRKHKKQIKSVTSIHKKEVEDIKKEKIETYEKQIERLEKEVEQLTKTLADIASRPNSIVNNSGKITISNRKLRNVKCTKIKPLIESTIESHIALHYNYNTYEKGLSGLVEFIRNMIEMKDEEGDMQRNYVCTDGSRNVFYRLLESQEWKKDDGAQYLNTIFDKLRKPALHCQNVQTNKGTVLLKYDQTSEEKAEFNRLDQQKKILDPICSGICSSIDDQKRKDLLNDVREAIKKIAQI